MDARQVLLSSLALALGILSAAAVGAQDFRVETEVFTDDAKDPIAETLTIFVGDVVYDFLLNDPEETAVFDVRRGRIVLLDPARRVKTTLTTDQLLEFTAAIKARAFQTQQQGIFEPQLDETFDTDSGKLILASQQVTYQAKGIKPKFAECLERYRDFADWYARLNAARTGNLPPFARIELNRLLAEKGLVPEEIERTVTVNRPVADRKLVARSRHAFTWLVSTTDRKRIEKASGYLASFQPVGLKEYWGLPEVASRDR